jgi:hypothetical protein
MRRCDRAAGWGLYFPSYALPPQSGQTVSMGMMFHYRAGGGRAEAYAVNSLRFYKSTGAPRCAVLRRPSPGVARVFNPTYSCG